LATFVTNRLLVFLLPVKVANLLERNCSWVLEYRSELQRLAIRLIQP